MLTLPDSMFAPVPARRLAQPDVAWFDSRRIDLATVQAHADAAPGEFEPDGRDGVRIEGIGRTLLPVSEAAATVVWSRILAAALPHGAVPAYALVSTGGACRAVLLRQFTPRPAHYLDDAASGAAVERLAEAFQHLFGDAVSRSGGVETINDGLGIVVRRHAEQVAACFAKRVFPGAAGPAALALDGRVLECGGARHVPGYRRATGDAQGSDQWLQHEAAGATLRALRHRIGARLPAADVVPEDELVQTFRSALGRARELHLLKMTGLPAWFIRQEQRERRNGLYHCLRAIYRHADAHGAACDLSAVLANAASVAAADLDGAVRPHLDDDRLRREFIDAYADARERCIAAHPAGQRLHARLLVVLQASRLNADLGFLTRADGGGPGNLDTVLRPFDAAAAGVGAAIDALAARGRYLLADLHPGLAGPHARAQVDSLERLGPALPAFVAASLAQAGAAPDVHARVRRWFVAA
jgi:hypothetical protein